MSVAQYPADAKCAVETCGHPFSAHQQASNCDHCADCDKAYCADGTFDFKPFHDFVPVRYAGGAFTADGERDAYERAMKGL